MQVSNCPTLRDEVAAALDALRGTKPAPPPKPTPAPAVPPVSPQELFEDAERGYARYEQLARIMLVIELVAPLRYGVTVDELHPDICEEYGNVCPRTVRRDLAFLETLALVDRHEEIAPSGQQRFRWIWRQGNFRAIVHQQVAEALRAPGQPVSLIASFRRHAEVEGLTER